MTVSRTFISIGRQLVNDMVAAFDVVIPPVCTRFDPEAGWHVVGLIDARFLALIDDLVEMHPRRHLNRPLRARPRGYDPIIIDAEFVLDDLLRKAAP